MANSQKLYYPMKNATIAAGFMNAKYKQNYGYPHYGVDYDSLNHDEVYDVLSIGDGEVLGAEHRADNPLGGILVVRYNGVYFPSSGKIHNVIARYYHIKDLFVGRGENLFASQAIGLVDPNHKWWNHVHLELDTDVNHPFHTPQVNEKSSNLLIRAGATDETLLNPNFILYVGSSQTARVHPNAIYATSADTPRYREEQGQKLILPVNNATVTAGYKNEKYAKKFGFRHFGIDMIRGYADKLDVFSPGNGKVLAAGYDNVLGNVLAILYPDVINHRLGKVQDVIIRFNHMEPLFVKKNQLVGIKEKIGKMGSTGKYSQGVHLHMEVDTDAREKYTCYTPTLSNNSNIMKAGTDSTINPADVLYKGENQSIDRLRDGYSSDKDICIENIL